MSIQQTREPIRVLTLLVRPLEVIVNISEGSSKTGGDSSQIASFPLCPRHGDETVLPAAKKARNAGQIRYSEGVFIFSSVVAGIRTGKGFPILRYPIRSRYRFALFVQAQSDNCGVILEQQSPLSPYFGDRGLCSISPARGQQSFLAIRLFKTGMPRLSAADNRQLWV